MANAKNTIQNIPLVGNLNLNTLKTDVSQFQGFNNKNSTMFGGELAPFYKTHNDYNNQFRSSNFMPIVTEDGQEYFMTLEKQLNASDHPELPRGTIVDKNNNTVFQGTIALPVTNEIDVPPDTIWATQMYTTLGILQVYITRNKLCWKVTDDPFQGGTTTNNIDIDYV